MRMEKNADSKKTISKKEKTRNADGKYKQTNKQTKTKGKEIFLLNGCHRVGPFMYRTCCQYLADRFLQVFSQFFEPCIRNSFR